MSTVEAKHVWKIYGGNVEAVKDISFRCEDQEFVAILGPSGCGKSSTLRMLAGLEEITRGEMLFDGKVVNDLSPRDRNVALAFESYALYLPLTVYENIAFPLRAKKMTRAEIDRRVMEIAEALELMDVLPRKPGKLSGGQQQRVSLARALVRNPSLLLLDEPLSHMDQRVRTVIRARIRRIHDELSTTTIYVTHDQEEAVTLADKIIVMNLGEIQQIGTVEELMNYPANRFVAGFIGEPAMNFLEGRLEGNDRVTVSNGDSTVIWALAERVSGVSRESKVIVGIRPQKMKVATQENPGAIRVTVQVVEFLGDFKILTMVAGERELKAIVPVDLPVVANDPVWIWADGADIHLFHRDTGEALVKVRGSV